MFTWLLLVSLFYKCMQDGNISANGVSHCGPRNLTLTSSDQMVLLTWEDDPSCSAVNDILVYELLVLIADKQEHYEEVAVMPDQIGSTHAWNWTSHLALACASHAIKLRSRHRNHTSPWKQEQTEINSDTVQVYQKDRIFKVGSSVTFCCVVPAGDIFSSMTLNEANMNTTKISDQTYTLTVLLDQPSKYSCDHVTCRTRNGRTGVCAYIGYAPRDRDLQCETRNLQSVECHWTVEDTHIQYKNATEYRLLGGEIKTVCARGSLGRCTMLVEVEAGERKWTLTAENAIGKVELYDIADLTKRVHMYAPERLTASTVNARNVTLAWGKVQHYSNLSIRCQVNVSHDETETISEYFGVGLHIVVLNNLIPHWTYNVTVRCTTADHFWKWSDWSTSTNFLTQSDVPDALDVWMQVKGDQIVIIWKKPLANQSHGHVQDYEVTWAKTTERKPHRTKVHNEHSLHLSLNRTEKYTVTVTARNMNGSSQPSTITVPSVNPETVETSPIVGSNGSFDLSWTASPTASCGYIVDWCPVSGHHMVEWLKVPPNETNASIFSKEFIDGVRYSLSVYACTQGAPVLLQRREGYVSEKRIENDLFSPLKYEQQDTDVVVSWNSINLKEQSAFIQGYTLYCLNDNNEIVFSGSTGDPEATSLTARNLQITSYRFKVKARTAVGECGTTVMKVTLNSLTDNLLKPISISLVAAFCLLSLVTILCYRHWTCIKETVYPPIPKPVLIDKWFTASGENTCHPLQVEQCYGTEADVMDVSELHCNSLGLENGYVSPKNMFFVFTQAPKGYINQPSQSGVTSAPLPSVISNPSYNILTEHQEQPNRGPELPESSNLEINSSGYQPQSKTEIFSVNQMTEAPDSPMSCISTYILLPPSK